MAHSKLLFLSIFFGAYFLTEAVAEEVNLQVNDPAPKFSGLTDENQEWKSSDYVGKKILVVYFYPANMTPGCTKQACNYRDAMEDFKDHDVKIVGVSGDSAENHRHFKKEHDLNFTLLSDSDGKIAKAFGVKTGPGGSIERVIGGEQVTLERGVTTSRWTFVIDKDGNIAYKDASVNHAEDTAQVLEAVKAL